MSGGTSGQRAILQVRWGPMAFRKAILEPGQALRVGRAEAMDLALPHDSQLAGAHFALAWDGIRCRVQDLRTTAGTLLDGKPIKESLAAHGSWIRAGGTDFTVHFERHTPPGPAEKNSESPPNSDIKEQVLSALIGQEGLYAVLDTANSNRILTLLQESIEEHHSLYLGPQGAALEAVAPYLVRLSRDSSLLKALVLEGWGNHWGVYVISAASLTELRRHLRKFLMVEVDGSEGRFYFRFYDPRVLHHFLAVSTTEQRKELFGPISRMVYEDVQDNRMLMAVPSD